jgi:branched-chain amino acid transport system ATP-binding protein
MLEATDLCIAYGDATAVWNASLTVGAGELVAVVGPNGAGKTTLINAIAGILSVRSGTLRLDGDDLARVPRHGVCGRGVALVPEGRRLFTAMTVEENLEMGAYTAPARRRRAASAERVYETFPLLRERRRQLAGTLSGGQQQMVAIGRALMACPRLLLLDEPSLGLAPTVVDQLFAVIRAIHRTGVAVLLVEQNVTRALAIASRAYVLEEGRTVAEGAVADLLARADLRGAYLGETRGAPPCGS